MKFNLESLKNVDVEFSSDSGKGLQEDVASIFAFLFEQDIIPTQMTLDWHKGVDFKENNISISIKCSHANSITI